MMHSPAPRPSTHLRARVLLIAEASPFREALSQSLREADFELTIVADLAAVYAMESSASFPVAIVEYDPQRRQTLATPEQLRRQARPCLTVLVAETNTSAGLRTMVEAGAHHVLGAPSAGQLIDTVGRTLEDANVLWTRLRTAVVADPSDDAPQAGLKLSQRETTVLRLIALGYRYQEIGRQLSISERTVKMHAANLRRKTRTTDRYELIQQFFAGELSPAAPLES